MRERLSEVWEWRAGMGDCECVVVTVMLARVSEGKTLTSDRCGRGLRQGSVWPGVQGD